MLSRFGKIFYCFLFMWEKKEVKSYYYYYYYCSYLTNKNFTLTCTLIHVKYLDTVYVLDIYFYHVVSRQSHSLIDCSQIS